MKWIYQSLTEFFLFSACQGDKFTCNFGGCIDIILFCDRFPDCADGSDEPEGCNEPCLPTQKQCRNGRCIDDPLWCNGEDNCKDGSDERNCPHLDSTKL